MQWSVMDEGDILDQPFLAPEIVLRAIKATALLVGTEEATRFLSFRQ